MKKFGLSLLVAPLLLLGTASGQDLSRNKSDTAKVFTLSGKVSEDGKTLIAKNGQPWPVTNSGTLTGHEGQQVKVKCQISSSNHDIRVLSVKTVPTQTTYAFHPGDSAFRR